MTKTVPRIQTAPNKKYPPDGLMASLIFVVNFVTMKAHSQLNLKLNCDLYKTLTYMKCPLSRWVQAYNVISEDPLSFASCGNISAFTAHGRGPNPSENDAIYIIKLICNEI